MSSLAPPFKELCCSDSLDFQALLKSSTLLESERISGYDCEDNIADKDCAIQALHDFNCTSQESFCTQPELRHAGMPSDAKIAVAPSISPSATSSGLSIFSEQPELEPPEAKQRPNFSHLRRAKKRKREAESTGQIPRKKVLEKYLKPAVSLSSDIDLFSLPVHQGAYGAKLEKKVAEHKTQRCLEDLIDQGFEVVHWDGRNDRPLTDNSGCIFGALVGIPQTGGYLEAVDLAYSCMLQEGRSSTFLPQEVCHRRGTFPAINVGVTHGKGTLQPVVLDNKMHKPMVQRLLNNAGIQRMAGYASASFGAWAPNVYQYYKTRLDTLFQLRPSLTRNFQNSVFPTAAFNLGDQVCTDVHRDPLNCPFGVCSIQPVGKFDHTKGGHLVLWELKKVIEFPSGSLILIPSATITHSNLPVSEGETRLSFTQYSPGGLFRYVDYGLRTEKQLKLQDPSLYNELWKLRPNRWKIGLSLLSNLKDIQK